MEAACTCISAYIERFMGLSWGVVGSLCVEEVWGEHEGVSAVFAPSGYVVGGFGWGMSA